MAGGPAVRVDLRFSAEVPGHGAVEGTLTGEGRALQLRVSDPVFFAGRRDASLVRGIAAALAEAGLRVSVIAGDRPLLLLGAVDAGWLQRRLTGSRHLRIVGVRGAFAGARGRTGDRTAVLPGRDLIPPGTLYPLVPTLKRAPRAVTTTHDPRRGGSPRLVLAVGSNGRPEDGRIIHPLRREHTTIGSDESCDIRLDGLAPVHAVVVHDDADELVLVDRAGAGSTRVNGLPVESRILRTGSRVELGPWTFSYWRAEYADHGRPYGGRIGGELGHQKPQPARHLEPVAPAPDTDVDPEASP